MFYIEQLFFIFWVNFCKKFYINSIIVNIIKYLTSILNSAHKVEDSFQLLLKITNDN